LSEKTVQTNDYSSSVAWTGDLNAVRCNLSLCWSIGKREAISTLKGFKYDKKDLEIDRNTVIKVTMLKPFGVPLVCEDDVTQPLITTLFPTIDILETNQEEDTSDLNESQSNENLINFNNVYSESYNTLSDHLNFGSIYNSWLDVDGSRVHKSNAINSYLNNLTKLNCSRSFRYHLNLLQGNSSIETLDDTSMIKLTDVLVTLAKIKSTNDICAVLITIEKITLENEFLGYINHDRLPESTITGRVLSFKSINNKILWTNCYNDEISVDGTYCIPFCLDIVQNDEKPDLEINLAKLEEILDLLVTYLNSYSPVIRQIESPYSSDIIQNFKIKVDKLVIADGDKLPCLFSNCKNKTVLKNMRTHVAKHLLRLPNGPHTHSCGFCGKVGCSINLVVTSGRGSYSVYGPESNCVYAYKFSLKSVEVLKKNMICSNRPIQCKICNNIYWFYNFETHYKESHPNLACPYKVTSDERSKILK